MGPKGPVYLTPAPAPVIFRRMAQDYDISELARALGPRAIELLGDTMETAVEDRDKIRAAEAILDRGYGKAAQAIIAIPANRRQAALLAGMSDEALVAVIAQKQLPRLGGPQPMTTIPARTPSITAAVSRASVHGPLEDETALDPLLL